MRNLPLTCLAGPLRNLRPPVSFFVIEYAVPKLLLCGIAFASLTSTMVNFTSLLCYAAIQQVCRRTGTRGGYTDRSTT